MPSRRLCPICKSPWPMHTALCQGLRDDLARIPTLYVGQAIKPKGEARMAPLVKPRTIILEGVDNE